MRKAKEVTKYRINGRWLVMDEFQNEYKRPSREEMNESIMPRLTEQFATAKTELIRFYIKYLLLGIFLLFVLFTVITRNPLRGFIRAIWPFTPFLVVVALFFASMSIYMYNRFMKEFLKIKEEFEDGDFRSVVNGYFSAMIDNLSHSHCKKKSFLRLNKALRRETGLFFAECVNVLNLSMPEACIPDKAGEIKIEGYGNMFGEDEKAALREIAENTCGTIVIPTSTKKANKESADKLRQFHKDFYIPAFTRFYEIEEIIEEADKKYRFILADETVDNGEKTKIANGGVYYELLKDSANICLTHLGHDATPDEEVEYCAKLTEALNKYLDVENAIIDKSSDAALADMQAETSSLKTIAAQHGIEEIK
jgi:hypothetical protein